ncbi:MAG: hypothetical protein H6591_12240 [Flavobacteriales bacterium]|nr:hypothetical protein [Flavobacteriales bacterium]
MMKDLVHEYVSYGHWATARFVDRLMREGDAVLDAPTLSSFPTLRKTVLHIRDAENAWTCRLLGEAQSWPADPSTALSSVMPFCDRFVETVKAMDEEGLRRSHAYKDLKGNAHSSAAWRMILHCVNHGTQHRGQLITMMRALGLEDVPANDLIVFQRLQRLM